MTAEDVKRLKGPKVMVACFCDDILACAALDETVGLTERMRKIKYDRWKSEGGCRLKRIEPTELNRHPVFLEGGPGMDLGSFAPRDGCERETGIVVMSFGYGAERFHIGTLKPRNYWRGILSSKGDIAGFRRLVIVSNDPRFMSDESYRRLLNRKIAEALYGAAVDADYAKALFARDAEISLRPPSDASASVSAVQTV